TGTCTACAFLAPGFLGAVLDFCAIFLGTVTATCVGLIGNNDLVNQCFVEVATEDDVGSSNGSGRLSLFVQELEFHELCSFRQFLDRRTPDDIAVLVARNCALDQQQAALCISAN